MKLFRYFNLLLLSLTFIATGCDEGSPTPTFDKITINKDADFLVFGEVYRDCIDDCREFYLLLDTAIYRDANDLVALQDTRFRSQRLPYESFLFARELLDVPSLIVEQSYDQEYLLDYIGDTDSYLYGQREGIYFELTFDAIDLNAPEELKNYGRRIQNAINNMNQ
ncbi:MAG TPA: hypothetical protein VJ917_05900 [Saprospiraceae bacterium]|nr:hypothetical protein [Saprospiraceae bacterium]